MIVGVVGSIASGKSVLLEMLVAKGFLRLSFSDEVRAEARARGLLIERKILQDIGNEMRQKFGNNYWAKRLVSKIIHGKDYVIEGIRNPGEIEELRKLKGFVLIGVDAPIDKRFQWIMARDKDSDPKTIEGIKAIDARDRGIGEPDNGQQVGACFAMADKYLINDSNLDELKKKAEEMTGGLGC